MLCWTGYVTSVEVGVLAAPAEVCLEQNFSSVRFFGCKSYPQKMLVSAEIVTYYLVNSVIRHE